MPRPLRAELFDPNQENLTATHLLGKLGGLGMI